MLRGGLHVAAGNNRKLPVFMVALKKSYTSFPFKPWCPAAAIDVERAALYVHVSFECHEERENDKNENQKKTRLRREL